MGTDRRTITPRKEGQKAFLNGFLPTTREAGLGLIIFLRRGILLGCSIAQLWRNAAIFSGLSTV